jgi:hypothetical protein
VACGLERDLIEGHNQSVVVFANTFLLFREGGKVVAIHLAEDNWGRVEQQWHYVVESSVSHDPASKVGSSLVFELTKGEAACRLFHRVCHDLRSVYVMLDDLERDEVKVRH